MYFLKLYYKFLEWEWYTNANVMRLFIHCLLKANRQTKKWQGITIERGSFITSYNHLAIELNLSTQQVRTALDKLENTGEITRRITRNQQGSNTMIIVNNYNEYQPSNTQDNTQITLKQHSNNTQITTTKECNNVYNEKNDRVININAPNPNNIFNPIVKEFQKKIKEILNYSIRLSGVQCDKVVELNQRIDDFSATIPLVLERLKKIQWNFDDGSIVNADIDWLLKNENYVSVLSGKFTSKAEIIRNWKPKGERDYER